MRLFQPKGFELEWDMVLQISPSQFEQVFAHLHALAIVDRKTPGLPRLSHPNPFWFLLGHQKVEVQAIF